MLAIWPEKSPKPTPSRYPAGSEKRSKCCLRISNVSSVLADFDYEDPAAPKTSSSSQPQPRTCASSQRCSRFLSPSWVEGRHPTVPMPNRLSQTTPFSTVSTQSRFSQPSQRPPGFPQRMVFWEALDCAKLLPRNLESKLRDCQLDDLSRTQSRAILPSTISAASTPVMIGALPGRRSSAARPARDAQRPDPGA